MSSLGIVFDERFKLHEAGALHPERPQRLDAIAAGLEHEGLLAACKRIQPAPIDLDLLATIHSRGYIERVRAACDAGESCIDTPDSGVCPLSFEVARLAAGAAAQAARSIAAGVVRRAFCAVRPPGHHAERDRSMGFCLFANAVVAARVLQREGAVERVMILDWDVHHGNGTQHLLEDDPSVLFVSLHGHPDHLYPGTGYEHETGVGAGAGFTLNVPLPPGTGDEAYRRAFRERVVPAAERFAPQAIVVSCGFDAHADDPLGNLALDDETFLWLTREIMELARRFAGGRILSLLEGGYSLSVLRRCAADHVRALAET